jgi:hypothetical protein
MKSLWERKGSTLIPYRLDSIPDLGVRRSFTNITGINDETREQITQLSTYEFDIRIPEKELKAETLPEIAINLYRTKEPSAKMTLGIKPLSIQFERDLREVARLKGIKAEKLPKFHRSAASAEKHES